MGCDGSVQSFRILTASDIGYDNANTGDGNSTCPGGSKLGAVVKLLQDTSRISVDDQALLFIQFPELMEAASAALTGANIPHLTISINDRLVSSKVAAFQTSTEKEKSKVLILNLGGVTASGL